MNLNPKIDEFITEIVAVSEYLLSVDYRTDSKIQTPRQSNRIYRFDILFLAN